MSYEIFGKEVYYEDVTNWCNNTSKIKD